MEKLTGQMWEECPLCGQEPIYQSNGGYCKKCGKQEHELIEPEIKEIYGDEYGIDE